MVFADRPANAEPLVLPAEVNAYSTSDRPCGPVLAMLARGPGNAIAIPVPTNTASSVVRINVVDKVISRALIFLPRYSGVRPTISPAINTDITASRRRP